MTLILNNDDVKQVLTMEITMSALDQAYRELTRQEAVCRPRIDMQIPTKDPNKIYQWGTMEGGSTSGYFAIRMKSDVIYEQEYQGAITQEKYCVRPGRFCGLILLNSIENGEPLALINDGYLQHMRVGADSGIGAKYMAREDAEVVGMIGSGGMARSHVESFSVSAQDQKNSSLQSDQRESRQPTPKRSARNTGLKSCPWIILATRTKARISSRVVPTLRCRSYTASGWKRARTSRASAANRTTKRWNGSTFRCVSAMRRIRGDCPTSASPMNTSPMPPSLMRTRIFK